MTDGKYRVLAVVVTYNRVDLLKECLEALQSVDASLAALEILIMDNASTDGTEEYVKAYQAAHPGVHAVRQQRNIGGSGGFCEGIRYGMRGGYDFFWLMDDDTIVGKDSLRALMNTAARLDGGFGYLASQALWTDGSPCVMNEVKLLEPGWSRYHERIAEGILPIQRASFVSLLLNAEAVRTEGLPIRDFFIWGDDHEYTDRIAKKYDNYYVPSSLVVHKMAKNVGSNICTDEIDRVDRYFYAFRNDYYVARQGGKYTMRSYRWGVFCTAVGIFRLSRDHRWKRLTTMLRGVRAGRRFRPEVESCAVSRDTAY